MSTPAPTAQGAPRRRVLLYGDGNINLIDGSTIWLVSMAQVLARTGSHVTLFLKAKVASRRMLEPLDGLDNVIIVDPFEGQGSAGSSPAPLDVVQVAHEVVQLDRAHRFDKLIARGFAISNELARTRAFDGRLWPYVIDLPEPDSDPSPELLCDLEEIALASERMLVQTEDSRSYMEFRVPASVGKCVVLQPMIPDDLAPLPRTAAAAPGRIRGVYSGKFAEGWRTLELCDLPRRLAARGVDLSLSLIGDKFMHSARTPTWRAHMRQAVGSSSGVMWAGGMSRDDALAYARTADIGFSWRAQTLDSTHEISTKVLEYCAMGVAPVLNRITAHIELLGEDYPLLVDESFESVEQAISRVAQDSDLLEQARKTALDAVDHFRMTDAADRIRAALEATEIRPVAALARQSAVLVGEDLHASRDLHTALRSSVGSVRVVEWDPSVGGQNAVRSAVVAGADVVVLESAEPYLPWLAEKIASSPNRRLIVHVSDLEGDERALGLARLDVVDAFVFDTERDRACFAERFDFPPEHLYQVPVPIDTLYLDRSGLPGRQFRIGVLDLCPSMMRPDVGVDVLRELVSRDDRFSVHIRDMLPWDREDVWADRAERDYYQALLARIADDPALQARVAFEEPGADLPGWYRKIGWLLVPPGRRPVDPRPLSAAAAGVVVRAPATESADELYGADATFSSLREVVESIATTAMDPDAYEQASAASRKRAAAHDIAQARSAWQEILRG